MGWQWRNPEFCFPKNANLGFSILIVWVLSRSICVTFSVVLQILKINIKIKINIKTTLINYFVKLNNKVSAA